jgi:hypothetical protein
MEEMKKFIRYVVPGLVVVVEFSGILMLILFFNDKSLLKKIILNLVEYSNGIGVSFFLFLLSGGLGAFLATAYHTLISSFLFSYFNVDYLDLLKFCEEKRLLRLKKWDEEQEHVESLNKLGQWRILTSFWHMNKQDNSKSFKEAERRAETLHDIAHGQGAQLLGSILVLIMLFIFGRYYPETFTFWWYFLPGLIIFLHFFAFKQIILSIQNVLSNIYIKEFENQRSPITLYVNKKDLKLRISVKRQVHQLFKTIKIKFNREQHHRP